MIKRLILAFLLNAITKFVAIKLLWNFILVEYFGLQSLNNIHALIILVVCYLLTLSTKFKIEIESEEV